MLWPVSLENSKDLLHILHKDLFLLAQGHVEHIFPIILRGSTKITQTDVPKL